MDLPLPPPDADASPFGLVSVCGLLTELEDVGRVVALVGYGHEARRLPFLCTSLARDDELLVATRTAVYGTQKRTRLMYAARTGDVRRVTTLLRPRGTEREVDAVDAEGRTALHHASASGRVEAVRLLLAKGADKDKEDTVNIRRCFPTYWRPLHFASAMGHAGAARLLLDRGAATDVVHAEGGYTREQPLHVACAHGHVDIVRLLLDAGADEDARDANGRIPYIRAVERSQEAVVVFLLDRGQDVDGTTEDEVTQHTALFAAAWYGQESMARLLLDKGADIDTPDGDGRTASHAAAWTGSASLTRLFLSLGADWEATDAEDRTPFDFARSALYWAEKKAPVDPQRVQTLSDVVGIYEALEEGVVEGEGE
jgi:ankyrin repeat protein